MSSNLGLKAAVLFKGEYLMQNFRDKVTTGHYKTSVHPRLY